MKHPWAWVFWLAATLIWLSTTRNPLYLALILLCVLFVGLSIRSKEATILRLFSIWKLAAWIIIFATLFNAFISHYGETILFTIPGKLPLISGKVTLEAVVYGATNGLILTGILASFTVLNLALPVRDLISLIPRAFYPVAVVTSIAVTYLPTTVRQFQQIREAQAVRGHRMRTFRDWLPLLMPLLIGGLEHAMQLAEAMTARGFASFTAKGEKSSGLPRLFLLVGVVLMSSGWLLQMTNVSRYGWVALLAGALLILLGLWQVSRQSPRTAYHRQEWIWLDGLSLALSLIVGLIPIFSRVQLYYDPYPVLQFPGFDPLRGVAILGLLIPGVIELKSTHAE